MALVFKRLSGPTQLTNVVQTLYTVPASTTVRITELLIANNSRAARKVSVHFVPSGSSPDATNLMVPEIEIKPHGVQQYELRTVLNVGDFVAALADVTGSVNLLVSGAEIT